MPFLQFPCKCLQNHMKLTLGEKDLEIQSNLEFAGLSISGFVFGLLEWFRWFRHGQKEQGGPVQSMVGLQKAESVHVCEPGLSRGEVTLGRLWGPKHSFLWSHLHWMDFH